MANIAVIGSGSWGTAASLLLARQGHHIRLWSYFKEEAEALARDRENKRFLPGVRLPDAIACSNELDWCVQGAELIVMVTPSSAVKATAEQLAPHVADGTVIVNLSKGLEQDTLERMSVTVHNAVPQCRIAVMSGPSHAEEVALSLPTTNVVAAEDEAVAAYIQDIFMCDTFRVYTSSDMVGVELGGALKNVIALCAGMSDGLKLGDNAKAALMTRGMAEIARLGTALGADIATFSGLSGVGDLIVTCTSMHSRNRRAGILIGEGVPVQEAMEQVQMVVEGVYTTKAAYRLAQKCGVEMPITTEAYRVLFENKPPKVAVMDLMCRDRRHEKEQVIPGFLN